MSNIRKRIDPWIVKIGMMIYLIAPGGSVILVLLALVFPGLFREELKKLWKKTKAFLRKIGIIKG